MGGYKHGKDRPERAYHQTESDACDGAGMRADGREEEGSGGKTPPRRGK